MCTLLGLRELEALKKGMTVSHYFTALEAREGLTSSVNNPLDNEGQSALFLMGLVKLLLHTSY